MFSQSLTVSRKYKFQPAIARAAGQRITRQAGLVVTPGAGSATQRQGLPALLDNDDNLARWRDQVLLVRPGFRAGRDRFGPDPYAIKMSVRRSARDGNREEHETQERSGYDFNFQFANDRLQVN